MKMPRAVVQEGQQEAAQREGEGQQAPCVRVVRAACLACLPYSALTRLCCMTFHCN